MKFAVEAGSHSRAWCPVQAVVPVEPPVAAWRLVEEATGQVVPCQWRAADGGLVLTWILDSLEAGGARQYGLVEADAPSADPGVTVEDSGDQVEVTIGNAPFTTYNYGAEYARPFLYPVIGPYGHGLTRNYPMVAGVPGETSDHPHHRSLYTAFGEVNGVDDWSEGKGHGRIVHRGFSSLTSGPVYGRIVADNDWVSQAGQAVVRETREMVFYNTPADSRVADYTVVFHAGEEAVTFGDTKEGGILSVRVATSMDVDSGLGGRITNAHGGIDEEETWGRPSPWCDYSGPVAGRLVGVAVLDHPDNLRYPTQWHVRNYGLMTANCFGWSHYKDDKSQDGSHTIPPHTDLAFRYRVYVHVGGAEGVAGRSLDFAFPPKVVLETA